MRSFFRAVKAACLFVGSVVGAGFATGREIALFFGGGSVVNVGIAAAFMGAAAFLFLETGAKRAAIDPRVQAGADAVVAASSFVVYAAMIASAESVLFGLFGKKGLSLFVALFCAILSPKSTAWASRLNFLAVPALVAIVIFVGVKTPFSPSFTSVRPFTSAAYGAMNMLFSGALMVEEGRALSKKERLGAAALCGGLIFVLLLFMFRAASLSSESEMPFLVAAERAGMGSIAPVALLLAIVTTMVGCDYLVTDKLNAVFRDPILSSALVLLFGYLLSLVGFAPIVRAAYPVVSYLGIAFTFAAVLIVFASEKRRAFRFPRKQLKGKG